MKQSHIQSKAAVNSQDIDASMVRIIKQIDHELDIIRELAETSPKAFEYQTLLWNMKSKLK